MGFHPIPVPSRPIHSSYCVPYGDAILILFEQEVTYTCTQTPSSPSAFSPQLPFGTFFAGDFIGPFTAGNFNATVTINYKIGGSPGSVTINVKATCP